MNLKKYWPILEVLFLSAVFYLIHKLFFFLNGDDPKFQDFHFPIEAVYGFFFVCSIVILFVLIKVKAKNIDYVGYTFILLTFIKMAGSYAILYPILHSGNQNMKIEKIDFFIVFASFLAIETVVTIRLLNDNN